MFEKSDKNFVSELDTFLDECRKKFPESEHMRKERLKHEMIAELRDNTERSDKNSKLWDGF